MSVSVMADGLPKDFGEVARRFSDLWQVLASSGEEGRSDEERRLLIDRIRGALDRGEMRLSAEPTTIIANSFVVEKRVHDGIATEVFRTRHRELDSLHAVKMLKQSHADDPVARAMLLREAEIGLCLRHPAIVATQALLRCDDGRPVIVYEWAGESLSRQLARGTLSPGEIYRVMLGLLAGLDAVHEKGVVHGDIAPANLLLNDGSAWGLQLCDFSIAVRQGGCHADHDLDFAGQVSFSSPEQVEGRAMDRRSDLFSAGRLLSLLLAGRGEDDAWTAPLAVLASRLTMEDPQLRPENAKAALALLGGLRI